MRASVDKISDIVATIAQLAGLSIERHGLFPTSDDLAYANY